MFDTSKENYAVIRECIKKIAWMDVPVQTEVGKVLSVDREKFTVDVEPLVSAPIFGVRLRATIENDDMGMVLVPKVGSFVVVSLIGTTDVCGYVAQYSEIDEMLLSIRDKFKMHLKPDGSLSVRQEPGAATTWESDDIALGGTAGQPVVKGNDLNDRLGEILDRLQVIENSLNVYATAQIATIGTTPSPLTPLVPALNTLLLQIAADLPNIAAHRAALPAHLSSNVKTS